MNYESGEAGTRFDIFWKPCNLLLFLRGERASSEMNCRPSLIHKVKRIN